VSKFQRTHDEPFRSAIQGADLALEHAKGYVCVGFGFRDTHIEPKLVERCRVNFCRLQRIDHHDRQVGTELRQELAAIIDYLAVDKASHIRYQPQSGVTFCNIYAHDYCHLAGVYLPRVWWTPDAIERLAQGQTVEPRLESTIDEQRANDLFRWLRAFGSRFGWRQTGTLTKLQTEANAGAVGIIVARRTIDGKSGHIVMVVPETDEEQAKKTIEPDEKREGR